MGIEVTSNGMPWDENKSSKNALNCHFFQLNSRLFFSLFSWSKRCLWILIDHFNWIAQDKRNKNKSSNKKENNTIFLRDEIHLIHGTVCHSHFWWTFFVRFFSSIFVFSNMISLLWFSLLFFCVFLLRLLQDIEWKCCLEIAVNDSSSRTLPLSDQEQKRKQTTQNHSKIMQKRDQKQWRINASERTFEPPVNCENERTRIYIISVANKFLYSVE